MHRLSGRRPSPAMAVAFVALLAALSGTAVALPGKNGVDSGDIRKNAVNSKKVKNNSLLLADFKASERSKLRGPAGAQGAQGPAGPQGPQGPVGPSRSFFNDRTAALTIPESGGGLGTPITTLTLPGPATYLVQATGTISRNLPNGDSGAHQVQLRRDDDLLKAVTVTPVKGTTAAAIASYSLVALVNVPGPSNVVRINGFNQNGGGTTSSANHAGMTATLVGEATGAL